MEDSRVFGPWFEGASWANWRLFLKALFSLPLSKDERGVLPRFTARSSPPQAVREAWLVVGRRGGKSLVAALVAVYLACFRDCTRYLAPGERGTVMVIAADRNQARVVMRYVGGFLEEVPMLAARIERKTQDSVDLANQVTLEVHTASFRSTRGYSIVAAICDEIAYWRSEESANPDTEILNAIRPGMATIPGSLLLCMSSPYARRGELWNAYRRHFGKETEGVLIWKAGTRAMNPTIAEGVVQAALEQDRAAAEAEYLAEFRRDVESYVSLESVQDCIVAGRRELPSAGNPSYVAFTDPSGGSQDSMTVAIAHPEREKVVLDVVREARPPFSPESVVREFSTLLKRYRISVVFGDRYAGEWPPEQFARHGVRYRVYPKTKSDLYGELLSIVNSGRVELLDHSGLIAQLCNLERRTSRGGKDSIDHPPSGHDDLINAAAGAILLASRIRSVALTWGWDDGGGQGGFGTPGAGGEPGSGCGKPPTARPTLDGPFL